MADFSLGFMWPDVSDPYVYLNTLTTDNNFVANWVGGIAASILGSISADLEQEHTENALIFLQTVAGLQQSHEMAFLRSQINALRKNGHGEIQESIIDELESMMGTDTFDYNKFITTLNVALQDIQRFKNRIRQLDKNSESNSGTSQIEGQKNLTNSLQSAIGNFVQQRAQYNYSQEELIRTLTYKFFMSDVGQAFISQNLVGQQGALNISAAIAVIQNQLAKYIYDNGFLIYRKTAYKNEQEFLEELKRIEQQFDENFDQIGAKNILSNQHIIDEAIKLYGLKIDNKRQFDNQVAQRGRRINKQVKDKIKSIQDTIGNPLDGAKKSLLDALKHVQVTWKGATNISIQAELESIVTTALSGVHMGSTNMATDVLLGTLSADVSGATFDTDPVMETLKNIRYDIEEKKAANHAKETSEIYIQQLDNLSNTLEGLGKAFILHETTKLYQSIEKGDWFRSQAGFHGRSMAILSYIDNISEFGGQLGVNTDWLKFAAYNLSDNALGSALKAPLETYFAIAAGLIMFDDFSIMAKEATEGLQFSNVSAVHLYNLNGIYVPASYFLNATYQAMAQVGEALQNGGAFTAKITAPSISYSRSMGGTMESRWSTIKSQGAKASVSLTFAANFLNFVSNLFH